MRHAVVLFSLLALLACSARAPDPNDSGRTGNDAATPGSDTGTPGNDAATPGNDVGPNPDHCFVAMPPALSTVGCNGGFVSGTAAAMNAMWGPCTIDMAHPQGSCTMAGSICNGFAMAATMGFCYPGCTPPAMTYSSTSGCPTGSRCFPVMGGSGVCYRDCDATHPCPTGGGTCDADGSCS